MQSTKTNNATWNVADFSAGDPLANFIITNTNGQADGFFYNHHTVGPPVSMGLALPINLCHKGLFPRPGFGVNAAAVALDALHQRPVRLEQHLQCPWPIAACCPNSALVIFMATAGSTATPLHHLPLPAPRSSPTRTWTT
jgi:hypothetical protein